MRTFALAALILVCSISTRASATIFVVNDAGELPDANLMDGKCDAGGGKCTLVAAMQQANADSAADVIQLPPGTYVYTATLPTVTTPITIEPTTGTDPRATVIQSSSSGHPRLFNVTTGGNLTLDTLTLEDAQTGRGSALQVTSAAATLTNCVVTNNMGTALYVTASGSLTLSGCTISNNPGGTNGPGGMWIDFSNVIVSNTTFSSNSGSIGGAAYIYTASDDSHTDSITGSTFKLNVSTGSGGALYIGSDTVTIDSSTFNGNASAGALYGGGAIYTTALKAGTVITNSTFTANQANNGVSGGNGGAIFALNRASCTGCTFSQNVATGNGGAVFAGANDGAEFDAVDSTFFDNVAFGGGAISTTATVRLASVTITKNSAGGRHGATNANGDLGGGGGTNGTDVRTRNTIIAGNTSPLGGADCEGQITGPGYNLVGDATNCSVTPGPGNQVGTAVSPIDPGLGALDNNGGPTSGPPDGPTKTCALLASSPAGDAGNPSGCTDNDGIALATDQRGQPRAVDGNSDGIPRCDIGAYEAPSGTFGSPTHTTTTTSTTSSTSTSTTSSTTRTTIATAQPTTTSTSTPRLPTTTTTMQVGCAGTLAAATFVSIDCRLDALLADLAAEPGLGSFGPKLIHSVQTAKARKQAAESLCRGASAKNAKKMKKQLQQAAQALTQYVHRLNSLAARKKIPSLRQRFVGEGAPILADLNTLRHAVRCPDDAV
jgi:parallel beta-helix repeat protein/predicted outer membrane repeat protein